MTNSILSEDETVEDTESTDAGDTETSDEAQSKPAEDRDETDEADDARPERSLKSRLRLKNPWRSVAAVLAAVVMAGGVFGFMKYQDLTGQIAQLRRAQADRDTVAQLAKDYALKSLTYSFEDPDAFFRSVEDGVAQPLKEKYVNATDVLKTIMLQAQVTSTGEVLATDPVAQPGGDVYQVVVSAHRTTRNMQNPTPKVSIILLQVTVTRAGNGWQVSDIGPKTGSHPPVEDQIPPSAPPAAPAPPPAPAPPAKPTPKR
jgi:Mce-associated membrane protein